ncbi:MAG: ABC transporter permease [Burkholderiaceae bacterium]|jgi:phospholipid/cholesterol/gamma-HCH transport system permease protein|nr:ABC transporter permease [Burkholderiaceae bacterium]
MFSLMNVQDDSAPRLIAAPGAQDDASAAPQVSLRGAWTAARLTAGGRRGTAWRIARELQAMPAAAWDLRGAQAFDHLAALMLWRHWGRQWPAQVQASDDQRALLARVAAADAALDSGLSKSGRGLRAFKQNVDQSGQAVIAALGSLRDVIALLGQLLLDALRLMAHPVRGPWRDFSGHLYRIGAQALPITALVGFLIGVVLAYLMSAVLRQFGAETFVVNILGLALIRELGPLLAAVLVAGRSGSSITAQIGVMRVTEELDAMRVLGIPAGFRLVLPRALALALAMPLVAVWTTLAALVGGMLVSDVALNISPPYFFEALPKAVDVANLWLATGKSVVFGLAIALIGCHYGLRVKPDTVSLGQGTTASVVTAITAVILIDALFAVLFRSVGM